MTAVVPSFRLRRRGDEKSRERGESRRGQQPEFPLEFPVVFHGLPPLPGVLPDPGQRPRLPTGCAANRLRAKG